ncbi:hypothetical protein [Paenibacillus dendritiformis]
MVELTDEYVELWTIMLRSVDFKDAVQALNKHIQTSKYAPTIAEIVQGCKSDAERKKRETAERVALMTQWGNQASLPAGRQHE